VQNRHVFSYLCTELAQAVMEDWSSAAPTIGTATGSTKVGKREWRSGRIHRSAHLRRRRAARWPAANLNGSRRRLHAAVVLRCISSDGKRQNGFILARGCLRRPRFAPVGLHAGESSMVGGELGFGGGTGIGCGAAARARKSAGHGMRHGLK
jgi:hypothetical protein